MDGGWEEEEEDTRDSATDRDSSRAIDDGLVAALGTTSARQFNVDRTRAAAAVDAAATSRLPCHVIQQRYNLSFALRQTSHTKHLTTVIVLTYDLALQLTAQPTDQPIIRSTYQFLINFIAN